MQFRECKEFEITLQNRKFIREMEGSNTVLFILQENKIKYNV